MQEAGARETHLSFRHAHGFGGFKNSRIDGGEADVGVAQDGENRVKHECDNSGARADSANEG